VSIVSGFAATFVPTLPYILARRLSMIWLCDGGSASALRVLQSHPLQSEAVTESFRLEN